MQITIEKRFLPLHLLPIAAMTFFAANSYAANSTLNISAQVLDRAACAFTTTNAAMNFGNLDPAAGVNATATAGFVVRCNGNLGNPIVSSISLGPASNGTGNAFGNGNAGKTKIEIGRNNGLNSLAGSLRMRHATIPGVFIPYSLNYLGTPWTAGLALVGTIQNNTNFAYSLGGTILAADYQNASIGAYSDTVVFTITP